MDAAYLGHEDVVKLLLTHSNIQVNDVDSEGSSALTWAARRGHESVVQLLVTCASDVNAFDSDRDTASKLVAQEGCSVIVGLLLDEPNIDITVRSIRDRHTARL